MSGIGLQMPRNASSLNVQEMIEIGFQDQVERYFILYRFPIGGRVKDSETHYEVTKLLCAQIGRLSADKLFTFGRLNLSASLAICRPRFRTHLMKSVTFGISSKLNSKTTQPSDSFHKSVLKRPEQLLRVEVQKHDNIQA